MNGDVYVLMKLLSLASLRLIIMELLRIIYVFLQAKQVLEQAILTVNRICMQGSSFV